mmetsp:Transcript_13157/g.22284  ORF Transcript_13157/g.22284 Transcript_13157/m.22284 type:complete len:153 (-) Transcript_13157:473-931(-)
MLVASYAGGHLLDLVGVRNIFLISATFPVITVLVAIIVKEPKRKQKSEEPSQQQPLSNKFRENIATIYQTIKIPFILKPLVIIILVIIAPSVDDAMFYFNSDVLNFTNGEFSNISVISQIGSILGQQSYRFICKEKAFKTVVTLSTILFCLN